MEQDEQCKFGDIIRNDEHKTPVVYGGIAQTEDEGGKSNLIFTMELRVGPG